MPQSSASNSSHNRRSPRPSDRATMGGNLHNALGTNKSTNANSNASAAGSGTNPDEPIDVNLLNDIPAWLRTLRLHKYTPNFDGSSTWKEMIMMTNTDLENKGVAALGARRKLLKVFENIRNVQGIPVSLPLPISINLRFSTDTALFACHSVSTHLDLRSLVKTVKQSN